MRFSWTSLILAPLLVPLILSAALVNALGGDRPLLVFLILLVLSCVVSYATTVFLFLPCLFLLSLWRPLTGFKVCLLGLALGAAVFVPLTWMEWKSSGTDSGPPTRELLHVLRALDRRSTDRDLSAGRADNGSAVLVAGDAAARPVNTRAAIVTAEYPPGSNRRRECQHDAAGANRRHREIRA